MIDKRTSLDIDALVRKNIMNMKPYSSAREEFRGTAEVYLDANENPYPTPYNRYPDPLQLRVKEEISKQKCISPSQLFLGNGSDEAIDLLIRAFCEPNKDSILITEPTYGMYAVCAEMNAVNVKQALLTPEFDINLNTVLKSIDTSTKIIFLCSPNNPTGNLLSRYKIMEVLDGFNGLVVIDEAYVDFAKSKSFVEEINYYPNLVVLQTFSKAWGMAGLRLGVAYASIEIISILNKIKYPYNINILTQEKVLEALVNQYQKAIWVESIISQRERLSNELRSIKNVNKIFPSDSNFLLVRVTDAPGTHTYLMDQGIIVRDRSSIALCNNCLRITIGTSEENKKLIEALKQL